LSERIVQAVGAEPSRDAIVSTYRQLADCGRSNRPFTP
jgi:hypothetical protein